MGASTPHKDVILNTALHLLSPLSKAPRLPQIFYESIHLKTVYLGEDRAQVIKVGIPSQHGKSVIDPDTTRGLGPKLKPACNFMVTPDPWFHILIFNQPQIG